MSDDQLLRAAIDYLRREWHEEDVGLVAAILVDQDRRKVATSKYQGGGIWLHAERVAIESFMEEFGLPRAGATMAVTLSPCLRVHAKSRTGGPCIELLRRIGVSQVTVGAFDPLDSEIQLKAEEQEVRVHLTEDRWCRTVSERLLAVFSEYGERVNFELPQIKQEIGSAPFRAIDCSEDDQSL